MCLTQIVLSEYVLTFSLPTRSVDLFKSIYLQYGLIVQQYVTFQLAHSLK